MDECGIRARQWCKACFKADMYRIHDPVVAAGWHAACTGRAGEVICECPCSKPVRR